MNHAVINRLIHAVPSSGSLVISTLKIVQMKAELFTHQPKFLCTIVLFAFCVHHVPCGTYQYPDINS